MTFVAGASPPSWFLQLHEPPEEAAAQTKLTQGEEEEAEEEEDVSAVNVVFSGILSVLSDWQSAEETQGSSVSAGCQTSNREHPPDAPNTSRTF